MAIIAKEAVVNIDHLQTPSFKEKDFTQDWSNDPLFDFYDIVGDPNAVNDSSLQFIPEQPEYSSTTRGITAETFVEKLPYLPDDSYYFDLSQNLNGYSKEDLLKDWDDYVPREIPNLSSEEEYEESVSNRTLFTPYGATTTSASVTNYLGDEEDLKQYWVQSSTLEINNLEMNIVADGRGLYIKNNSYTNDIYFSKPITITVEGYYCFSGFFRLYGNDNITTKISGLHFVPSSTSIININSTTFETFPITSVKTVLHNNSNYFEVHKEWSEIALVSYLPAGTYNAIIYWPQNDNEGNINKDENSELRVAGLRIDNQKFPLNFDYRKLRANKFGYQFPIQFNLNNITSLLGNDWAIYFRRYMRCNLDNADFANQIGNITFGYQNNQIFIGDKRTTFNEDLYNKWGLDMITHNHADKTLTFRTFGKGFDYTTAVYSYADLITEQDEDPLTNEGFGVTFNLELGGYVDTRGATDSLYYLITHTEEEMNAMMHIDEWRDMIWPDSNYVGAHGTLYSGFFRDLVFVPRLLTEEELSRIKSDLLGLSKVSGYKDTTPDTITLRNFNFLESSFGDVE